MDNKDNNIIRHEENGVEYFTVVATGESGMSQRGLARACGVHHKTIQNIESELLNSNNEKEAFDLATKSISEWLKPLIGKRFDLATNLNFLKRGKEVKIYNSTFCSAVVNHFAFSGRKTAQVTLSAVSELGLASYIQEKTGWLPKQYQSNKEAREILNRVMDAPRKFKPLFGDESVQKVSTLTGYPRTSVQIANWFWKYVYYILNSSERAKLNRLNPVLPAGYRKQTIHQWLDENLAEDRKEHFRIIEMLIELACTQQEFDEMFKRKFHKTFQLSLFN